MPSKSEKQRRFMGAELARKRAGKRTQTGMSEKQLGEFASDVQEHGSLEDITYHEEAAETDVLCDEFTHPVHKGYKGYKGENTGLDSKGATTWGALDPPAMDGEAVMQFTKGSQSCNRDAGQGLHYGTPVDYFGPDTDYRAEEIDPHQYGKDWEPFPLRDYFKSESKVEERGFRMREEDENFETRTPGAVSDKMPQAEAYGAVNHSLIDKQRDTDDYRSFESQKRFARAVTKAPERSVEVSGIDTKKGSKIR